MRLFTAIADTSFVAILCESYVECRMAAECAGLNDMDIGFGDGMHYSVIQTIFDHTPTDRRTIFATQNPSVFDLMTFDSAEDARRRLLLVRDDRLVNMSEDQAREFYGAYERGVQYVSEILQAQGLW